jgi:crotonobetainyl-CoA:carnitine CoA-transferase CaiB-like acyl-CoA transferase
MSARSAQAAPRGVLDGIRVIDFGRYIAGPYCSCLLGDLGAEVIRVERLEGGEDRFVLPLGEHEGGAMFLPLNRNKKSIALAIGTEAGRRIIARLVASADVVVANLPPQALAAMGIEYASLRRIKPDIILTSLNAFGSGGPWSERLGFDGIAQAMSGLCYMTGHPGDPQKTYGPWADFSAATFAAFGTLAALRWRDRTGEGQEVEAALLAAALVPATGLLVEQAVTCANRGPSGNRSQTGAPADLFRTLDGSIIMQVIGNAMFRRWARLMGDEALLTDPRFQDDAARVQHAEILSNHMTRWCASRTTQQALDELARCELPAGPVLTPQQVLDHEQVNAVGTFQDIRYPGIDAPVPVQRLPVRLSASPGTVRTAPPTIGEHTDQVLAELGHTPGEIAALRAEGVI